MTTTTAAPGWQMMARLARIILTEHRSDTSGHCPQCREPAPCPTAQLAGVGLGEACGLTTPHRRALRTKISANRGRR